VNSTASTYCLVVGAGITGRSIVRHLQRSNVNCYLFDTRLDESIRLSVLAEFPTLNVYFGEISNDLIEGAVEVFLSPGLGRNHPVIKTALAAGKNVCGDIELFLREKKGRVVGVTGSNGKSTVVSLLGELNTIDDLKIVIGGNIGIPALDLLDSNADIYVLELSSFQLESIAQANLDVALMLNLTEDHMDRYGTMDAYATAKQHIFTDAKACVVNADDEGTWPHDNVNGPVVRFSLKDDGAALYSFNPIDGDVRYQGEVLFHQHELALKGLHNIANVLSVLCVAELLGLGRDKVIARVKAFPGLTHRCEFVRKVDGIDYLNDSKATNVGASVAAINGLKGVYRNIFLIAGGEGKGADFSQLGTVIDAGITCALLIGIDAKNIAETIKTPGRYILCECLAEAVESARDAANDGDLVLLSPACASFDAYKNYEARGDAFKALVSAL
jgi:UDP-N-acetylmuramoylalanine--D-glutamate ligase